MIRLLLLLVAVASATPPPRDAASSTRMEGFHRVFVTPDAFADGLAPEVGPDGEPPVVAPTPPPAPERPVRAEVQVFVLDPQDATAVGHTATTLAEHLRTVDNVASVEISPEGDALLIGLDEPQDLATLPIPTGQEAPVPLGSLGEFRSIAVPPILPNGGGPPRPVAVPKPERGHDLVLENVVGVKVVVKVDGIEVGELKPHATGVIHDVRPGTYEVGYVGPTGFEREADVATTPITASRRAE